MVGDPEQVVLELGQLGGALERGAADDEGDGALGVSVLVGVEVEEEGGYGAFEACDGSSEDGEARAGHGGGFFGVVAGEGGCYVIVPAGCKVGWPGEFGGEGGDVSSVV